MVTASISRSGGVTGIWLLGSGMISLALAVDVGKSSARAGFQVQKKAKFSGAGARLCDLDRQ
jgi:hypothetical protein